MGLLRRIPALGSFYENFSFISYAAALCGELIGFASKLSVADPAQSVADMLLLILQKAKWTESEARAALKQLSQEGRL